MKNSPSLTNRHKLESMKWFRTHLAKDAKCDTTLSLTMRSAFVWTVRMGGHTTGLTEGYPSACFELINWVGVRGCFRSRGKPEMVFISGGVDGVKYAGILADTLLPFTEST